MTQVTIHQVAQAAGVSITTVSNFLNGRDGRMLPETGQRISDAIQELGYRPNKAARQLRTGQVAVIGLVVPSVANPFWGNFARYLEGAALERGFQVLLCNSERDPVRERGYIEELWADGIRGVVLCSSLPSLDHILPMINKGLRVVAFDRISQPGDPKSLVNISVDNVIGADLATSHLTELGHRRLAFVSGRMDSVNRAERFRGFAAALNRAGIDESEVMVWPRGRSCDFADLDAAKMGREAARELMDDPRPPTGIVAINDMCALGICAGIREAGARVGSDVSIVGFDDIVLAELMAPPLTTVRQPSSDMATEAFSQLLQQLGAPHTAQGRSLLMRPELVVRESTAPPPAA